MRTAYLWCPAYPLHTTEQLELCRSRAQALAAACNLTVVESPLLARLGAPGTWLDADIKCADVAAGLGHDVLLAARGGFGCIDLLPALRSATRMPFLIGFSDLTVLHCLWRRRGVELGGGSPWTAAGDGKAERTPSSLPSTGIYGFMPAIPGGARALASAAALLNGQAFACDADTCPEATVLYAGEASGPLLAACLRVLASLVGTPAMPALAGAILALEDIDERPYQLERDLAQLWASGSLRGVAGLALGVFPATSPAGYAGPSAREVLARWAERLGVPAVFGLPIGHHADPLALPFACMVRLVAGKGSWRLEAL